MTENKLKGLFGGGEADDSPGAAEAARPAREGRRGGGGKRRGEGRGGGRRRGPEERAQAEDFIQRYTTGNPTEGFSSEEAVGYLRELRGEVPPEVMQRAAVETVRNLPDEQRKQFAEMLQRRQAGTGMVTIERTGETRAAEGRSEAQGGGMDDMFGSLFGGLLGGGAPDPAPRSRQQPQGGAPGMDDMLGGLLGGLLGGGMAQEPRGRGSQSQASDPFGDLLGGLLGGGTAAPETEPRRQEPQAQGGGLGDILGSPLGKAVLGGIAAYAMKEMMNEDRKG